MIKIRKFVLWKTVVGIYRKSLSKIINIHNVYSLNCEYDYLVVSVGVEGNVSIVLNTNCLPNFHLPVVPYRKVLIWKMIMIHKNRHKLLFH